MFYSLLSPPKSRGHYKYLGISLWFENKVEIIADRVGKQTVTTESFKDSGRLSGDQDCSPSIHIFNYGYFHNCANNYSVHCNLEL